MSLFWYVVGIVVSAALLAIGFIMTWHWLVFIGFVTLPLAAVWGMVTSGPGSKYNPYHR
ncbi:MAG TPA: hypothetical protein VMW62_17845 [Chloroflexota bacterium]|nr:hypothetical protein [Chloroflexota bacterium]